MQTTKIAGSERVAWGRLPWVALLAALTAAAINALVYFAASGLGLISQGVLLPSPNGGAPLTVSHGESGRGHLGDRDGRSRLCLRYHRPIRAAAREAVPRRRDRGAGAFVPHARHPNPWCAHGNDLADGGDACGGLGSERRHAHHPGPPGQMSTFTEIGRGRDGWI